MSKVLRAVTVLVILALLAVVAAIPPVSVEAQGTTEFTSPYNSAFKVTASVFDRDRTPAVSFSNHFAGFRQVDPLVAPGQARSHHDHAWLGTRLTANTNINRLYNAPNDWEAGSNAAERNRGFAGQTLYKGQFDGYSSAVWWPTIWDAPPGKTPVRVTYLDGISSYYVARGDHGNEYLEAYPNGLGFLIDDFELKMRPNGRTFNVNFFGPMFWDGRSLTSNDHRSHLSYTQSSSHPVAVPQFQTFVKARLGYPDDSTPLKDRIKFGNPGAWVEPHLDYVAGFRQPWFHQWLLDLGPNWGHPDNQLRDCGISMPGSLQRRKLEGVHLPNNLGSGGQATCSAGGNAAPTPTTSPPTTRATTTTRPPVTQSTTATTSPPTTRATATTRPPVTQSTTATTRPPVTQPAATTQPTTATTRPPATTPRIVVGNQTTTTNAAPVDPNAGPGVTTNSPVVVSGEAESVPSTEDSSGEPEGTEDQTGEEAPPTTGNDETGDPEDSTSTAPADEDALVVVLTASSEGLEAQSARPVLPGQADDGSADDSTDLSALGAASGTTETLDGPSSSMLDQRTLALALPALAALAAAATYVGLRRRSRSWL